MTKYKKQILKSLEELNLEVDTNFQIDDEWWIEDLWKIKLRTRKGNNQDKFLYFLVDKNWEKGVKIVDNVVLSHNLARNYTELNKSEIQLDMRKGNFQEKLISFNHSIQQYLEGN